MTAVVLTSVVLGTMALLVGLLLWRLDARLPEQPDGLIDAVSAALPQTQCAQCGHPGCAPYARALVMDNAPLTLCPPGGSALIPVLEELLGRPADAAVADAAPVVARIVEPDCIGCTLCIQACPVDAIVGANGYMHVVLEDDCTGCELCLPPCPVDCIELLPAPVAVR